MAIRKTTGPAEILVAITTASAEIDGVDRFVTKGDRLRSDDPFCKAHSAWFLPDGLPSSAYNAAEANIIKDDGNYGW